MAETAASTPGAAPGGGRTWGDYLSAAIVWVAVWGVVVAAKLWLAALPPPNIPLIRSEFAVSTLEVYALIGLIGVLLAVRAGLPSPLGPEASARERFVMPLAVGAGLGMAAALVDQVTHGADFLAAQTGEPTFNVAFPQSLPVYLAGPVLPEAVFHIFPLALLVLLTNLAIRSQPGRRRAFYGLAAVVALAEPLIQGGGIIALGGGDKAHLFLTQFLPYFATNYPMNLAACLFFGRSGFLSPIATRLGFYLVWHIAYGNFLYHPHLA